LARKKKLSKLSDSDEALLAKRSKKERSIAVDGKPDRTDVENLTILFSTYDKYTQGLLTRMINQNKIERAANNRDLYEKPASTAENLSFFMPKDLQEEVEKYWPTLWTNKEHLRWFLTKFPEFRR
jgi:hypothetical protein